MRLKMEANITLMLREQDVNLLLKAVEQFSPQTDEEEQGHTFLLDILRYLVTE
jgi:hypothetical protein